MTLPSFKLPFILFLLAATSMFLSSCQKDETPEPITLKSQVEGSWTFTSVKIDSIEMIGFFISDATSQFEPFTGQSGTFKQSLTFFLGLTETVSGTYSVDETSREITMTAMGETEVVRVTSIQENRMVWESEKDGERVVSVLER